MVCFTKDCDEVALNNGDVFCEKHYQEWCDFENASEESTHESH